MTKQIHVHQLETALKYYLYAEGVPILEARTTVTALMLEIDRVAKAHRKKSE